jgi:hypothetical protein
MVRLQRNGFHYLATVAPLILGFLILVAMHVFGGSPAAVHTFPLPQPAPVGP